MIIGHFLFTYIVSKHVTKTIHQLSLVISNKIIDCYLITNISVIPKNLEIKVSCHRFFILYNNINFYKNI